MVAHFYDQLFAHGNLEVIDKFVGSTYTNHNPQGGDGPEALRRFVSYFRAANPNMHHTVARVIAEDDLVLLHSRAVLEPGTAPQAVVDIFRVEDGRIVEHWDVIQPVPATSVSGHDMFTTLSAPADNSPDPLAPTAESKRVVEALFHTIAVERDPAAFDRYAVDPLYEHNPQYADGVPAAKELFTSAFAAHPELTISVKRVIAEGDYVAVHHHYKTSADDLGFAVIDFFRVRDGKIVEHWDAIQPVPATSANDNSMF
ncbi:putative ester cyclase [Streptomyces chartreusis NRRL 3882]|uniref:Putative ester cyclase n=2 Tax=Streptomyces TaxID=1883 RepID=A0A2N9BM58_STRCX|nr:nuclear transport factor 2 family protein [Streptomyces sp. SID5464]SOR84450.1 putative ester cyclase [Streptomyces chartreusis NRRL 3882]